AISRGGKHVAFIAYGRDEALQYAPHMFVHDLETGRATRVTQYRNPFLTGMSAGWPSLSSDGSILAFGSRYGYLVDGDTNDSEDVFIYSSSSDVPKLSRASIGDNGQQANGHSGRASLSEAGRYLVFSSTADNLVSVDENQLQDIFLRDRDD